MVLILVGDALIKSLTAETVFLTTLFELLFYANIMHQVKTLTVLKPTVTINKLNMYVHG